MVPDLLHQDRYLAAPPDFGGPHGKDWRQLIAYRNGLVHAGLSRPTIRGPVASSEPVPSIDTLRGLEGGWAARIVAERIRRLHHAAGTSPPSWLGEEGDESAE